ncbi:MAG: pyridoxamine 5'-phosphate oxidase [Chlorobi bacterium]|nr:pyridoxamine 5'-phosphate oxidase [Chlorobiota bacterium]
MNLGDLRRDFGKNSMDINSLPDNPLELLKIWMDEAVKSGVNDANAMVLSTVDTAGKPSSRVVLLKEITGEGELVFYTNYESRKGKELSENPYAALNFFWRETERQIRIEGVVKRTSRKMSEQYFNSRSRESNAGAVVSPQSRVIGSLEELKEKAAKLLSDKEKIKLPVFWGGYRLKPVMFEFWQGGKDRLHDRIRYSLLDGRWKMERLAP